MNKIISALSLSLLLSPAVMMRAGNNPSSLSDLNSLSDPTFTALHKAATQGDFDTVAGYEGGDINALDSKGYSPLYYAVANGKDAAVDVLLQKGAKPIEGKNIVTHAVNRQEQRLALSLMRHGFTAEEDTARQAIQKNYYSVLRALVPPTNFDINAQDPETGNTLLMESVQSFQSDKGMAHLLLQNGARGDIADKKGCLPIHMAVMGGMLNTVKLLLAQNKNYAVAPLTIKNSQALPLELYSMGKNPVDAMADELCKAGASAEQVNLTAVVLNAKKAEQVFEKLRALGASIDTEDTHGQTPLMGALAKGHETIASTLLEEQSSPKAASHEGVTLLHYAAMGGMSRFFQTIVTKYGISVDAVDQNGDTPLHAAAYCGKKEAAAALRALGAKEIANKKGDTPTDIEKKVAAKNANDMAELAFMSMLTRAVLDSNDSDDNDNDDNDNDDNDQQ
jgi:ankyrin repeat protein